MSSTFKLLLGAAFLNALAWIIVIPVWQYPDEQAHFAQVQDIAELGKSPALGPDTSYEIAFSEKILGTERDEFGNNRFTYHPEYKLEYARGLTGPQEDEVVNLPTSARKELVKNESTHNPPLYYLLGSFFYRIFYSENLFTRVYAVRILSIFLYLSTIFMSFKTGQIIFNKNKVLPTVLAALIAFMPMFVFSSTGVLPDPLTNLLFTVIIFLSLKTLTGVKIPYLIGFSLAIFLGVLTRQQFLISLSFILLAFSFQLIGSYKKIQKIIFSKFSVILIIALFLLKDQIYRFLVTSPFRIPESGNFNLGKIFNYQFLIFMKEFINQTIAQTLPWYWGVYKWLSLTVPHINYQIINRFIILAIIGLAIKLLIWVKDRKLNQDPITLYLVSISLLYFIIFAIWDYFFFIYHNFHFGYQGRYFFPLIVAHFAIILIGLYQLFQLFLKNKPQILLIPLVLLMIIFNDISLYHVAASYYDTSSLAVFASQVSQYKPQFLKGYTFYIIACFALIIQALFLLSFVKRIIKPK